MFAATTATCHKRWDLLKSTSIQGSRRALLFAGGDKAEFQELHEAYEKIMEQRRSSLAVDLVLFEASAHMLPA